MISTIVACDPGLATFGLVAGRVTRGSHALRVDCLRADVFHAPKIGDDVVGERERRTRELSRWLDRHLLELEPDMVAAEEMSFPRSHAAVVAICLAWGVLITSVDRTRIPLLKSGPKEWRKTLSPSGSEKASHRAALKAVPSFPVAARGIPRRLQVHAYDALGVLAWSLTRLAR